MLSIGAVVVPKYAPDANIAMARAEEALAEARRLPSDGSVIYRPSSKRVAERGLNAHMRHRNRAMPEAKTSFKLGLPAHRQRRDRRCRSCTRRCCA